MISFAGNGDAARNSVQPPIRVHLVGPQMSGVERGKSNYYDYETITNEDLVNNKQTNTIKSTDTSSLCYLI